VANYYKDSSAKLFVDTVQEWLKCCGATKGILDYPISQIPPSCKMNYIKPCDTAVKDFVTRHLVVMAGICIGVGIIMMLGMIFAIVLCCGIRQARRMMDSYRYK